MRVRIKVCKDCGNAYEHTVLPIRRCPDRDCIEQREAVNAVDDFVDAVAMKIWDDQWASREGEEDGMCAPNYYRIKQALAVLP